MRWRCHLIHIVSSSEKLTTLLSIFFTMNSTPPKILLTSGATQEAIDEVRYVGNRSSGKLGALLAHHACVAGHEVTLVSGSNSVLPAAHPRLQILPYSSAANLYSVLEEQWPMHDLLIMAAAVSDYTVSSGQQSGKMQRGEATTLQLEPTVDIVKTLATRSNSDQKCIAFALEEPDQLEERAKAKLQKKNVDAVIANPLRTMDSDAISAVVFSKNGKLMPPEQNMPKSKFARWVINHLDDILHSS